MKWVICAIVLACLSGCGIKEQVVRVSVPDVRANPQQGALVQVNPVQDKREASFLAQFPAQRVTKTLGVSFVVATASMWFSTTPQLRKKCTPSSCRRCATWAITRLRAAAHLAQSLRQHSIRLLSLCLSISGERFRTHNTCSQTSPFM